MKRQWQAVCDWGLDWPIGMLKDSRKVEIIVKISNQSLGRAERLDLSLQQACSSQQSLYIWLLASEALVQGHGVL